jgi:putative transposase
VRKVWNLTLQWRHRRWYQEHQSTNVPQANAFLTAIKRDPDYAYPGEVSSVPLQQVLRTQQKAFANFFAKRARYPRYKTRSGRQSAEYTRSEAHWVLVRDVQTVVHYLSLRSATSGATR